MAYKMKKLQIPWLKKRVVSLKVPITLCLVLFGIIPMFLCTQTILSSVKQTQIDERMVEVQNQCQILSSKIARTGYLSGEDKGSLNSEIETIADVYNGRIVVVNQDFKIVQDTFHIAENRMHIAETVIRSFQGETVSRYNRDKHYFAQAVPIYSLSQDKHIEGVLVMTASTEAMVRLADAVGDRLVLFQVILVLVLILAAVLAAAMMVRPFKEFQARLHHVEQGALNTDISSEAYRETRDISSSVAQTITKLQEMDQSRQEFVSNVSHELKTPITSIRVLADSLMGMGEVPVELYREFMEDISNEMVRPFKEFQARLHHVEQGALNTDISSEAYRETRDISSSVAQTITKLQEMDQSRQEFVSNVSHELKTPITSIRVLADSLMGMGEVPVELYREFMEDISNEIDRESKIIDDLLSLVKMDKSEAELNITQVNLNVLVEQILKRLRPIANRRKVELIFESIREVTADVDEMKLSLAITNLVENAIKYNMEEGWVRVTLDADHKFFYLKVQDSGIGIPEDVQDRIFERFYRVDKARSRETGGSGLGLAITRNVVLMHKGAIKLSSKEGEGSTFTLRIPLNYIA